MDECAYCEMEIKGIKKWDDQLDSFVCFSCSKELKKQRTRNYTKRKKRNVPTTK